MNEKVQTKNEEPRQVDFTIGISPDRQRAIVDMVTLKRLIQNLQSSDIKTIVEKFAEKLSLVELANISDFIIELNDEAAFHETCESIINEMEN